MIAKYNLKPTYFLGKGCVSELSNILNNSNYKNVLILYGGSSIKKNGVYDEVMNVLKGCKNINIFEFNGIEPNPRHTTINKAADYCRQNKIDLILAVGGGSVIDASKVIGVVATNKNISDSWDYVNDSSIATNDSIDIFSVLTLAGTGSENNSGSVVTNLEKQEKRPVFTPSGIPKNVFLDPTYTNSLPIWQLSSGIFDCFSHLLEQYYGRNSFFWTEQIIIANMKTLVHATRKLYTNDINDYSARENLMWTTSMSLNGTTSFNTETDWNVHAIEHSFSAKWDVTHGAGLALITPTYIKIRCEEDWFKQKTLNLAKQIFDCSTIDQFIIQLTDFIKLLKLPIHYKDFKEIDNISNDDIEFLVEHTLKYGSSISKELIQKIINALC